MLQNAREQERRGKLRLLLEFFLFFFVVQLFSAAQETKCPYVATVAEYDRESRLLTLRESNMNVMMIDTENLLQSHLSGKFLQTSFILWGRV